MGDKALIYILLLRAYIEKLRRYHIVIPMTKGTGGMYHLMLVHFVGVFSCFIL